MQGFSLIADVLGIISAVVSFVNLIQIRQVNQRMEREKKRLNQKVAIVLHYGADSLELPVQLRRAEVTRAEILGRLGMIPMKKKGDRFSLEYLFTPDFLTRINEIAAGETDDKLIIPCRKEEFSQFDA